MSKHLDLDKLNCMPTRLTKNGDRCQRYVLNMSIHIVSSGGTANNRIHPILRDACDVFTLNL